MEDEVSMDVGTPFFISVSFYTTKCCSKIDPSIIVK